MGTRTAPTDVTVITGDPSLPDLSKPGGRYNPEDLDCQARLRTALESLDGYRLRFLDRHDDLLPAVTAAPPDLVMNLCDTGYRNEARFELHVPALLEMLGVPYTGAPPACIAVCYDKALVRAAADALGVPVPAERYVDPTDPGPLTGPFPALVKPNLGDGSLGITRDAVVHDAAEAAAYLRWLAGALPGRAALIQEFLPGQELSVGVIGNPGTDLEILPPLEVDFSALPPELTPILSYESKSIPDSPYWTDIRYQPARLDREAAAALRAHTIALFRRLGLRDYARIDYRADQAGQMKLLEVNPNPAWSYDGKLALMAAAAGHGYAEMLRLILEAAERRVAAESG